MDGLSESFPMKNTVILGDSYSTFAGYNPVGYDIFYPGPAVDDVLKVGDTWWYRLSEMANLRIIQNNSWSGSTVCKDVRQPQPPESSFLFRMRCVLSHDGIDHHKPDLILLFGGTNDSWLDRTVGENIYGVRTEDQLWSVLPAFCEMLDYVSAENPQAQVVCIVNTDLKSEIATGVVSACNHYHVTCCQLHDIEKQNGHPTLTGMSQIAEQVMAVIH